MRVVIIPPIALATSAMSWNGSDKINLRRFCLGGNVYRYITRCTIFVQPKERPTPTFSVDTISICSFNDLAVDFHS